MCANQANLRKQMKAFCNRSTAGTTIVKKISIRQLAPYSKFKVVRFRYFTDHIYTETKDFVPCKLYLQIPIIYPLSGRFALRILLITGMGKSEQEWSKIKPKWSKIDDESFAPSHKYTRQRRYIYMVIQIYCTLYKFLAESVEYFSGKHVGCLKHIIIGVKVIVGWVENNL